jgi:hypothetical protein
VLLPVGVPGGVGPPEPVLAGCDELGAVLVDGVLLDAVLVDGALVDGVLLDGEPLPGGTEPLAEPVELPAGDEVLDDDPAPGADDEPDEDEPDEDAADEDVDDEDTADEDGAVVESGDNQPDRSGAVAAPPR